MYAISNHYGGLGGGHYTTSVHVSGVSFVLGLHLFIINCWLLSTFLIFDS
jgi:hypothetical protein